jgi:diketogulonate reductase-like aldo/keto reductase
MADLEASLKNLATDRIDIWLLHGRSKPEEVPDELLEAGSAGQEAGEDPLLRRQHARPRPHGGPLCEGRQH